jgi:hypothetical protein
MNARGKVPTVSKGELLARLLGQPDFLHCQLAFDKKAVDFYDLQKEPDQWG